MEKPTIEQLIAFNRQIGEEIESGKLTAEKLTYILNNLDTILQSQTAEQKASQVAVADKLSEIQKWCKPVSDEEAIRLISGNTKEDGRPAGHPYRTAPQNNVSAEAGQAAASLRRYAKEEFGWNDGIFYSVKPGFDWQTHAPQIGPCYNNWKNASQWQLKNWTATVASLVFWVPRMVLESCGKTAANQMKLLAASKKKYRLPDWCLNGFGSASYNTLLILEYFHRMGKRVPDNYYWIRSDTLHSDGDRLGFGGFDEDGLGCGDWRWDDDEGGDLGCFPSGVLPLVP